MGGCRIRSPSRVDAAFRSRLGGHRGIVSALAFTPCGRYLFSGSRLDRIVRLWGVASGDLVASLELPSAATSFEVTRNRVWIGTEGGRIFVCLRK